MDPQRPEVRGAMSSVSAGDSGRQRPKPKRTRRRSSGETKAPSRAWVRAKHEITPSGNRRLGLWLGGVRVSGLTILVVILTVMGVGILGPQINIFVQQRHEVADLEEQIRAKKAAIDNLQKERARWDDPAFIRAQARERLFYVMPGDISFIVINDVPLTEQVVEKPSSTVQSTQSDWMRGIFNSVMVAGLSDATPAELDAATSRLGSK
ncbi:MAG: hypothetical protein F2808_00520 [Actinobacteria bacterium]|uniref:Unannotated protein n=1 Tax=freshwater metagenome TaxID=449393 RepID=A0A6J7F9D1_9ZZZZ|nr:hypothetical protein [Actinomycetota bacterium]